MDNYCAFSEDHKCLKLEDYELTRHNWRRLIIFVMATG